MQFFCSRIAIGSFEKPQVEQTLFPQPETKTIQTNFQQGNNSYIGTVDTVIKKGFPDTNYSDDNFLDADKQDNGLPVQSILRFDNIFGSENNQIPYNAQIVSAQLELDTSNGSDI